MVATAARTILDSLERIPNKEHRTRVAFITVDSSLHFYSLSEEASEPQMLVVSDLEDVFLPQPTQLLANLSENMEAIKGFLEKLPDMFKATACVTNALGSALQAAYKLVVCDDGMDHWHLSHHVCIYEKSVPTAEKSFVCNRPYPTLVLELSNLEKMSRC